MGRDRWGDIYANMPVKKMVALYDYDPQELSPNVDSEVGSYAYPVLDYLDSIVNANILSLELSITLCQENECQIYWKNVMIRNELSNEFPQVELSFQTGDTIYVYGDMDDDGFYMGELNGVRGLVPSNFLTEAPPDYDTGGRGGRRGPPPHLGPQDHRRGPGPGARGPPPPPRDGPPQHGGPGRMDHRMDSRNPRKGTNN